MLKLLRLLVLVFITAAITTGCAVNRERSSVDPSAKLSSLKTIHVVQYAKDKNDDTGALITDKLRSYGYVVTNSPQKRGDVDANVTYVDKWFWDITMYMLELTVTIREPKTDFPLASANSYHTSLTRKSAKEMVDETVGNIFR